MTRLAITIALLTSACSQTDIQPTAQTIPQSLDDAQVVAPIAPSPVKREHIIADVYHYELELRVGDTPNALLRVHRVVRELAPWKPRPTTHAVMLLHGDFADFVTNFVPTLGEPASAAPGLAPYLAAHGIDAWGVDRRWTLPAAGGDISDFAGMDLTQELGDLEQALALAVRVRTATDGDAGPIALGGFSHGGELAYAYAASNGRDVAALAVLDVYYDLAPVDAALRAFACANADAEASALAQGVTDSDNSLFVGLGALDRSAPADPSPILPPYTNRGALLTAAGQTYEFAPYTPLYHLAAPILAGDGSVSAFRESSEDSVSAWFAAAPPHQSEHEAADLDAIWCGKLPRPELASIHVPLLYLGAAGAFGEHGLYSTTRVSSRDVTTRIVHRFGAARVAEDFGHGDLLYAADAPSLAWQPLASWLLQH